MAVRIGSVEADRPAIGGPDQIEAAALVGFVALACFELILDIRIAAVADQRAGRIAVAAVADEQWLEAAQPLGDAEHIAILEAAALRILRTEEQTSELQSLMRISYAVFCLKKKTIQKNEYKQH